MAFTEYDHMLQKRNIHLKNFWARQCGGITLDGFLAKRQPQIAKRRARHCAGARGFA